MRLTHKLALLLALAFCLAPSSAHAQNNAPTCLCEIPQGPPNPNPYFVGYLPFYKGLDWVAYSKTMDFTRLTHLDLAFLNPPMCVGPCTAQSPMELTAKNLTPEGLKAIVDAAHAHGTKVLASLGGAGGDKNIMQFYNANLGPQLADAITAYVMKNNLDGVDVDIEQPTQMGVPFTIFVDALVKDLRPKGKLITAAVAQYIQAGMQDEPLKQFDIVNIMVYSSNFQRGLDALNYYVNTKHIPKEKLTLGIAYFGGATVNGKHTEINYNVVLAHYPNAWQVDTVGGGDFDDGAVINYEGPKTVAQQVSLGRLYGGVMVWEMSGDDPGTPHSLATVIQKYLDPSTPAEPPPSPRRN